MKRQDEEIIRTSFDARKPFPLEDESVELIVTDPPWAFNDLYPGNYRVLKYDVIKDLSFSLQECYRVLKKDAHCYIFVPNQHLPTLFEVLKGTGFRYKQLIIWVKNTMGLGYSYRGKTESAVFLAKEPYKKKIKTRKLGNVFFAQNPYHQRKPVSILRVFVEQSSDDGDVVFDPFAGSGSIAKVGLDRRFWINDVVYGEVEEK